MTGRSTASFEFRACPRRARPHRRGVRSGAENGDEDLVALGVEGDLHEAFSVECGSWTFDKWKLGKEFVLA